MLRSDDKLKSMAGAAALAVGQKGAQATLDDVLALYRLYGPATGGDTPRRLERAAAALEHMVRTLDPARRGGGLRFDPATDVDGDALPLWRSLLSEEELTAFNRPGPTRDGLDAYWDKKKTFISHDLLACAYCCISKLMILEAGALATGKLQGMMNRVFGKKLNGTVLKAILALHARKGLIRCINRVYQFFPARPDGFPGSTGRCRTWWFSDGAPLLNFVQEWVPHRVDQDGRGRSDPNGERKPRRIDGACSSLQAEQEGSQAASGWPAPKSAA
jgi:hypothetical protein